MFVLFGTDEKGEDDVLAIFTYPPQRADINEVILRLPMYVYKDFFTREIGCTTRIPNRRVTRNLMRDRACED